MKKPVAVIALGIAKPKPKGSPPPLPGKSAVAAAPDADDSEEPDSDDEGGPPDADADDSDSSPDVDQSEIQGEPGTGYEDGAGGPFACHNCNYFDSSSRSCGQSIMMKKSQLQRDPSGRPIVDPNGCCEYVDRQNGAAPGGNMLKQEQGLKPRQPAAAPGGPPPYPMAA